MIDEYDVPLDKAFTHGYYNEMVSLVRGIFGEALKTNDFLQFSVLTGCLRVSKESIFTGLNNFKVLSITDVRFDEQFGFTDQEVLKLLDDYHLESHLTETKEWYDGYHFGDTDVYCPWDVINHVDRLLGEPDAEPQSYWINTSGNGLVKRFIDKADKTTKNEIERLIAGETIEKSIRMELTYDEIDNSIDNLWSILFTTGYLTQKGKSKGGIYQLLIPNKEVLLRCESEWLIQSNVESGDGFVDILVEPEDPDAGMIMELKYAQNFQDLEKSCNKAMDQIHDRRYDERLRNEGRNDILAYGIAFCKKKCKVVVERL